MSGRDLELSVQSELDAAYLTNLVDLGYGETWEEVVEYLVKRQMDDLLRAGVLSCRRCAPGDVVRGAPKSSVSEDGRRVDLQDETREVVVQLPRDLLRRVNAYSQRYRSPASLSKTIRALLEEALKP